MKWKLADNLNVVRGERSFRKMVVFQSECFILICGLDTSFVLQVFIEYLFCGKYCKIVAFGNE